MQPILIVCAFLSLAAVGVKCTPPPGGLFPVDDSDNKDIEESKKLIQNTLQEQAKNQDSSYITTITLDNIDAKTQVVAGTLYHFTFNAVYGYKCLPGSTCENKAPETKKCHAVIFSGLHNEPLRFHEEPTCE